MSLSCSLSAANLAKSEVFVRGRVELRHELGRGKYTTGNFDKIDWTYVLLATNKGPPNYCVY